LQPAWCGGGCFDSRRRVNSTVMFLTFHKLADWLNRNQGAVMTVLTFFYVIATILLVWLSRKSLKTATELEKNRLRPYVLFNISSSTVTKTTYASIKNLGVTAAYNVKVSIQPELQHMYDTVSPLTGRDILFLPPGEEITDALDVSHVFHQKYPDPLFEGAVEYENLGGDKFREPFRIDLTFLKKRLYTREVTVIDELKQINETLAVIARHLGRESDPQSDHET
jgi:hypothetical protein